MTWTNDRTEKHISDRGVYNFDVVLRKNVCIYIYIYICIVHIKIIYKINFYMNKLTSVISLIF